MRTERALEKVYTLSEGFRMRVIGAETPIGKVIDGTLGPFASSESEADLTLVLGEFPAGNWTPQGVTIGDRLLYDEASDTTTVFRNTIGTSLPRDQVEYVVEGNFRVQDSRVRIFVPSIPGKMSYFRSLTRGLARVSFARTLLAATGSDYISLERIELEAAKVRLAIIEPFLYYRLPYLGSTLVHGSVVSEHGKGLLFTGGGHIGKTTLALEMVKRGFDYLGDDLAILSMDGSAFPYPEPVRVQRQHLALFPEILPKLTSKMDFVERAMFDWAIRRSPDDTLELLPRLKISEIFEGAKVGGPCRIENVILIRKGTIAQPSLEEIDQDSLVKTMAAEIFWEFETGHWRRNQYIYAPSSSKGIDYLAEESEHRSRVRNVIDSSLRSAHKYLLRVPNEFRINEASTFIDKILNR